MRSNPCIALAIAGATVLAACGGSSGGSNDTPTGTLDQIKSLKGLSIYLGHQSVGANIMQGVDDWLAQLPEADRIGRGDLSAAGSGHWVDGYIGSNGDAQSKIDDFQANVLAHCADLGVAMMKFCWADSNYFDTHSAQDLLDAYSAMVSAVHSGCPGVTLIHITIPLMTSGNAIRESYNDLLRVRYGSAVFDLAKEESTKPDGTRSAVSGVPVLYSGYASDSGHLNVDGRDRVAAKLIEQLAALP